MRCQEVIDLLPILAYNELDNVSAARCHEHFAGCAACQAEWESIRGALSLLDQAPRHATQVDLAAICLRIARQQRRSRVVSRWTVGAVAAAAIVVGMVAAQLLAVDLEPGRLTVAWSAKPAVGPIMPDPDDRAGAPHEMFVGDPGAGQATQPVGNIPRNLKPEAQVAVSDRAPNMLVLLFEGDQASARRRRQNVLSLGDGALEHTFDESLARSREPAAPHDSTAEPDPVTYSDLRRKFFDAQPKRPTKNIPPGA